MFARASSARKGNSNQTQEMLDLQAEADRRTAVYPEVSLGIAIEIQLPQHHRALDRSLEDTG
tara:strand:+ start:3136 stop:3321 length:186 start_codon:yes stop_codon:yes gene_type:complete